MRKSQLFGAVATILIASIRAQVMAQGPVKQMSLMERAAPSVVRVSTPLGHGTGFFVSDDGWVVTNYHVVADAPTDPKTGYRICKLLLTRIDTTHDATAVVPFNAPVWGTVFKVSKQNDLALIRADEFPEGMVKTPFLSVSKTAGKIGSECYTIGMPRAGVLWSIRAGTVSGHGIFPDEIEGSNQKIDPPVQPGPMVGMPGPYRVTLTTCGTNPGDSGGPLFNADAEVIAVNHSIPRVEGEINLDKFSYHIHRDELATFLTDLPKTPLVIPPSLKHPATKVDQRTLEGNDCKVVTLSNPADDSQQEVTVTMVDLDGKGPILAEEKLLEVLRLPEQAYWKELSIDWAFVVSKNNPAAHFFDLDQDGKFENVLVKPIEDGSPINGYVLIDDFWEFRFASEDVLEKLQFASSQLNLAYSQARQQLLTSPSR
jgi:S1-C subfamily serine protease